MVARSFDKKAALEDLTFLADTNVGLAQAADRTGFPSRSALDKWLRNNGELELLNRLIEHERRVA